MSSMWASRIPEIWREREIYIVDGVVCVGRTLRAVLYLDVCRHVDFNGVILLGFHEPRDTGGFISSC